MDFHTETLSQKHKYIDIKPISDVHIGDPHHDTDLIQNDVDWITAKDNRFALLNGDIMDTATERSVSNSYESTLTPQEQLDYARKLFKPAAGSILGMTQGNHERRIYRDAGFDTTKELAFSLQSFYSREALLLKVRFGKRRNLKHQVYTIYMTHGFTGSRMVGGKANRLEKLRKIVVSDVYIVGHSHQKITFPKAIFVPDLRNEKVVEKKQVFINAGHYLNYGGYGQIKGYDPTDRGTVILRLYAQEKKIEVIS